MQDFLILINFTTSIHYLFFDFYVPVYSFEIEQLVPYNNLLGRKRIVTAKQRKVGALFCRILKQNLNGSNKAPTLRCFVGIICFVPMNLLFWTYCSMLSH